MNEGDQLVAKINFTLDLLIDNFEELQSKMDDLTRTLSRVADLKLGNCECIDE